MPKTKDEPQKIQGSMENQALRGVEHQTGLILSKDEKSDPLTTPSNSKNLPPEIVKALQSLRDANPSLQRMLNHGIATDDIPDESLAYWNRIQDIAIMENADKMESLNIKGLNLGGLMVRIIECVPFFQCLQDHDISFQMINFGGTDIPTQNLLQGLQKIQSSSPSPSSFLEALYLGGCGIGSRKGVQDLLHVLQLPLCSNITKLDLRYNDLSGEDMTILEPILSSRESMIEILHLEGNMLKCNGAKAIASILANTNSLKELYLGGNGIGVNGAKDLADGLKNNSSLGKLYLEGNLIGGEGADAFRMVLLDQTERKCKVLKHLYVENNGMGKDSAVKLGQALNSENIINGSLFD